MIEVPLWALFFVLACGFGLGFFIRAWLDDYLEWFDRRWVRRCK